MNDAITPTPQPELPTRTGPGLHQGQPAVYLRAPDGASAIVLLHGAQLVSWRPAGGEEQLYLSPAARYDGATAVRGGVPVIFPQFAGQGPLRHGLARTRAWQLEQAEVRGAHAFAVLRLVDDEATRQLWPQAFALELTLSISAGRLDMELAVQNNGSAPFEFQAALHTYLRSANVLKAQLEGLLDADYHNSARGDDNRQWTDVLTVIGELDRIYWDVRQPLTLREIGRRVTIEQDGFSDVVVWNPGAEKCARLADMPPEGWREMLCVEAARIGDPIRLAPGAEWVGMQSLQV